MSGAEVGGGGEEGVTIMEEDRENLVYMWGYLPGALPQKTPLQSPILVKLPPLIGRWKDVCGGGCGFAMAISDNGKLITWGSTDDSGQSYVASGKHGETPEPFPLPTASPIVRAAAGWAHCASVTDTGGVYTWGWRECIPSGKVFGDSPTGGPLENDVNERQGNCSTEQASPRSQGSKGSGGLGSSVDHKGQGEENTKRRKVSSAKHAAAESSQSGEENISALPCLVALPGVRVISVAAGGRHTLALSDVGQVWGWGYGGEGQLGMGTRIRMVSSPQPIPCLESSVPRKGSSLETHGFRVPGNYIKAIACGGRHSAVITVFLKLLLGSCVHRCWSVTYFWLGPLWTEVARTWYKSERETSCKHSIRSKSCQCGQGGTDDELSPTCVPSLLGIQINSASAGLWHTVCISSDGDVYAFGGNQFGQLGTGSDQAETIPRLLEAPSLENVHARVVSCGARHSAIVADDGRVFCWGWNKYGQLGLGDVIDRNAPSPVKVEGAMSKNVACGWWHTLLLAESAT